MRNCQDVIDTHGTLVRENARHLGLRHARAARNLGPAQILSIGVIAQNLSDESREPQLVIHVVNMPNGKTVSQVELTCLANRHTLLDMQAIPIGIAKVIDDAARGLGMTLPALAARTSLSYTSVFRKIREKSRSISVEELAEFAAALDMQASDLLARAEAELGGESS